MRGWDDLEEHILNILTFCETFGGLDDCWMIVG